MHHMFTVVTTMEMDDENGSDTESVPPPPLVFRMNENGTGSGTVRNILLDRGWREFIEGEDEEHEWNLWWRNARYRQCDYEDLMPWQRLNHFPKTTAITKKDMLARNMRRMKGVYGASVYNFTPMSFNLPNDYTKFVAEYTRMKEQNRTNENGKRVFWICKPADLSRGRGIFLFENLSELTYDCSAVVQQYLNNPCLIAGYKFDLRLYVLVTSFHPLTVYMYQEGLARFSTEKFDLNSIGNLYSHLTNTSINKFSPSYTTDKERIGQGSKWTLTMLRNYFHQQNVDDEVLWQRISNVVILTLLAQASSVPKVSGAFELFGFDIIIDDKLKPWLLEVNFNPALSDDCPVDTTVKRSMLHHVIDVLGFSEEDGHRGGEQYAKLKAKQHDSRQRKTPFIPKALPRAYGSEVVAKIVTGSSKTGSRSVASKPPNRDALKKSKGMIGTCKESGIKVSDSKTSLDMGDDYDEEIACVCGASQDVTAPSTTPAWLKNGSNLQSNSQSLPKLPSRDSSSERVKESQMKSTSIDDSNISTKEVLQKSLPSRRELLQKRGGGVKSSISMSPLVRLSSDLSKVDSRSSLSSSQSDVRTRSTQSSTQHLSSASSASSLDLVGTQSKNKSRTSSTVRARGDRSYIHTGVNSRSRQSPVRSSLYSKSLSHRMLMESRGNMQSRSRGGHSWPPEKVGDFTLLFPFNDATRRSSYPTINIRAIVKETQKELKRVICKTKAAVEKGSPGISRKTSSQRTSKTGGESGKCKESSAIWAPLKSTTLTAVEA